MKNQEALAAGQDGAESLAAPAGLIASEGREDAASDGALRRRAAVCMADQLEIANGLLDRCEHLATLPKGDRIKPIFAAARLLQSNARVAQALAQLVQAEQRRRTIIEHIQPPAPVLKHSNSNFDGALCDALMMKMLRYMKVTADQVFDPVLEKAAAKEISDVCEKENPAAAAETGAGPA
ncbi:MAG: hypothetical protein KGJ79_03950 [Alphaproteobacteria bacterium]|nr:hypothetical protein [Alphaproteobacteria bacterium]MDE2495191.1 hypothetical protein [Alphaproteobacteria bacterium]